MSNRDQGKIKENKIDQIYFGLLFLVQMQENKQIEEWGLKH